MVKAGLDVRFEFSQIRAQVLDLIIRVLELLTHETELRLKRFREGRKGTMLLPVSDDMLLV